MNVRQNTVKILLSAALLLAFSSGAQAAHVKRTVRHAVARRASPAAEAPIPAHVEFLRDVAPLLDRFGCSGAQCHGKFGGRHGFEVSLLTLSPADDYKPLVYGSRGRRINFSDPTHSLLLLKATDTLPHGGGERFAVWSRPYKILYKWIEEGAPFHKEDAHLATLQLLPKQVTLPHTGAKTQLRAIAVYTDGTRELVNSKAVFASTNPGIVTAGPDGLATAKRWGGGAVMVRYLGKTVASFITTPETRKGPYPIVTPANFIDKFVFANLKSLNVVPSVVSDDYEFVRRIYLDTLGRLPTPQEISAFVSDRGYDKRAKLIDALLKRPGYVALRTMRLADLLRVTPDKLNDITGINSLRERAAEIYYEWIRQQVLQNTPWNTFVHDLLTAQGSVFQNGPAVFYAVDTSPNDRMENVGQAFLGVRMLCARCHNHPFDRWTTDDYWNFSAFFQKVQLRDGKFYGDRSVYCDEGAKLINQSVLGTNRGRVAPPTFLGDSQPAPPAPDSVEQLADWVTAPKNPFFARAAMNRLWSYYFGQGIINPVDDMRVTSAESVPGLLDALAQEFIKSGYNWRHMVRLVLNSRTYQLSSIPNASNADDNQFFSHYYPHAMPAQVLLDELDQATGSKEQFSAFVTRAKAIETAFPINNPFTGAFEESHRLFLTDLDPRLDPTLMQSLTMINSPYINNKVDYGDVLRELLDTTHNDADLINACFLRTFCRPPTQKEITAASAIMNQAKNRQNGAQDLLWALVTSREFYFNH